MSGYIGSIDQGTTSTRFILFDRSGHPAASHQIEHRQIFPKPGWVEHDPVEVWENTQRVIAETLIRSGIPRVKIDAIGVTNQRETVVVWDRRTGKPFYNAVVWQDTRTDTLVRELSRDGGIDRFRDKTGLPLATYFSGPKIRWILDNIPDARKAAVEGNALCGTMDCWIIWNLTGGINGGAHVTDVTNASRTMMMNLAALDWDDELLAAMRVPRSMLPAIRPSIDSAFYGKTSGDCPAGGGIPVSGALGDQQAALVGQGCFEPGDAKNTYGTGCFLLMNTGNVPVHSSCGLITTAAYRWDDRPAVYALEGSIAITGALVQWIRDNIGLIKNSPEIEELAATVEDNGGVYFVPAFSGLYAPYWRSDARGILAGLTRFVNKGHIARAVLEATAFQTRDIFDAMRKDCGRDIGALKVDGGMVKNELLMQFQSDILGVPIIRAKVTETTALGAAYVAGIAVGFWKDFSDVRANWRKDKEWVPSMDSSKREEYYKYWNKAVNRTMEWLE
jgi:glycerol kinase